MQIVFTVGVPPVHDHPAISPLQVELHPTVSLVPSSHVSGKMTFPSPQIGVQTEKEEPVHEYPVSILQVLEQPSPDKVLLSSHYWLAVIAPSPQTSEQVDAELKLPP